MSLGHGDKWGPLGSIFAALCCLGAAPALAAISALGLGFLIKDIILIPLLLFFLVTLWALHRDRNRHGHAGPEWLAWPAALLTAAGLWISAIVVSLGLVLLVSASIWNITITQQMKGTKTTS
ncbi:MAG TPA: MerC family mercury resistance protein [Acidobacteriota bacterium]|jgi:mercuric ion transport protein|nr:MerC family mercury resistance protein [Acidobacteriota bacterium]